MAVSFFAGQFAPAVISPAVADDGFVKPGTRLAWHPVRPERTDDATSSTSEKAVPAKESDTADQGVRSANYTAIDAQCDSGQCQSGECQSGQCAGGQCATGKCIKDTSVQQCSGDDSNQSAKKPAKLHSVVVAKSENGDTLNSLRSKVRLAGGQNSSSQDKDANVALNDPFGDHAQPGHVRRAAMTVPEEMELPAPDVSVTQSSASPMRIEPAAQDPVELTPPEPLRKGLPKKTVKYQPADPAAPAPDLLPSANPDKLPLRNPEEACKDEYNHIKAVTLNKLSIDIVPPGNQAKGDQVPFECGLSTDQFQPRCWEHLTYTWKASALCHKPLYFEDVAMERYGHSWGPCGLEDCQSFVHFFGDLVLLPYMVGVYTPCECEYDLGYYRPGNCAPWVCDPFPLSCRGVVTGAAGYCGIVALFP